MNCFCSGTEFVNKLLKAYLTDKEIMQETIAAYNTSQNGGAERKLRTLQELGRAMAKALYAMNCTVSAGCDKMPFDVWTVAK